MASTNPPCNDPVRQQPTVKAHFKRIVSGQPWMSAAVLGKHPVEVKTPPPGKAGQLWDYLPDSIQHVAARELQLAFSCQIPALTPPQQLGAFKVLSKFGSMASHYEPGQPKSVFETAVAGLAAKLDPTRAFEAKDQADNPSLYFLAALGLQEVEHGRFTCYLADALSSFSHAIVADLKELVALPRPDDDAWPVKLANPLLPMPCNHGLPAGHATELTLLARVLDVVVHGAPSDQPSKLQTLADRMMENRVLVGVHTQHDNAAGRSLAIWLADQILQAAALPTAFPRWAALYTLARAEWP